MEFNKNKDTGELSENEKSPVKKTKFSKEIAIADFERFCEDWRINDGSILAFEDSDSQDDFEKFRSQIILSMMHGDLVYNQDDETFTYNLVKTPKNVTDTTLTLTMTDGSSWLGMDQYKEKQTTHKGLSKVAAMIKMPVKFLSKLNDIDLKILMAINSIFLGS